MLNRDLFMYDPAEREIPNSGVAKIGQPEDEREWATLRFELEHFVCKGQYEVGLERILAGYLTHMDQSEQPAVWVSGFYGSGKSHFLKVLASLWNDALFPGGASAQGLTEVSDRVAVQLKELETLGKRSGGLWAAAGTLGAGASGSVRLAFLGILFESVGLPTNCAAAKLVLWLKNEGAEVRARDYLANQGRTLEKELRNMYVSPHLGEALLHAVPGFASSSAEALKQIREGYPQVADINNDELCDTVRDVLLLAADKAGKPGRLPCTVIVMDELQQYIGDDVDRADKVLRIVEAIVSKFGSQILFVASGQSAMGATPQLLRLQDRFKGRVEFTDTDVDSVVRSVILQKAPQKEAFLQERLTEVSGEINRHLQGTKLAPVPDDAKSLVADYPLLPTRRRFWEVVLRAIDRGGTAAQLRTQLRSVQEAARYVANMDVGVVVPGDFIYEQQVNGMLHSGVLSRDLHETIEKLKDGSLDGGLQHRITALVFLIGQLKETNKDLGLRADAATLADLLVANLNDGSGMLRTEVAGALAELADKAILQAVDGEYSVQTAVSIEWQRDYQQRVNRIKDETARVAAVRGEKLQEALQRHVGTLQFNEGTGADSVQRKGQFVWGLDVPDTSAGFIPVWVRDEWSVGSLKTARDEAAARGSEDPVVHLLIPKRDAQAVKDEIVKLLAAQETLNARVAGSTEEGAVARAGMENRCDAAEQRLRQLMTDLMADAVVLVSGGNEIRESDLRASVNVALRAAARRMFPKFTIAEGSWTSVIRRVSQGSGTPLEVLGHTGDPRDQKVCAEVMKYLGNSGKRGTEIREHFKASPYGWSQDAIDGSLIVLARADRLKVMLNGVAAPATDLTQDKLGKFTFAVEQGVVLTADQRLQLRKMFVDAGVPCQSGSEPEALGSYLSQLIAIGQKAGGSAPLPAQPDLRLVREVESLSGNERLAAAWEHREEFNALWVEYHRTAQEAERRMTEWGKLETLARKCDSLRQATEVRAQAEAIRSNRALLAEPDPVRPLIAALVEAARTEIQARYAEYSAARHEGLRQLESVPEYSALDGDTWRLVVSDCGLDPLADLDLAGDLEVLNELDARPLTGWQDRIAGMKSRIECARRRLAEAAAPDVEIVTYSPPSRRLASADDVDHYVAEVRTALMKSIETGAAVIVQ